MKKVIIFVAGFAVGVLLLPVTVNAAQRVFDKSADDIRQGQMWSVNRWDDPQFQVKCWESKSGYSGGISCLPWDQVKER